MASAHKLSMVVTACMSCDFIGVCVQWQLSAAPRSFTAYNKVKQSDPTNFFPRSVVLDKHNLFNYTYMKVKGQMNLKYMYLYCTHCIITKFAFFAQCTCSHLKCIGCISELWLNVHVHLYHTSVKYCILIGPLQVVYFTY